ncbi:hypothetical protein TFLX_06610 [Thermoflexales bacterium]|nr:hypothetical protein TFLX_06610 [Thermoflexales bacterium]
MNHTLAIKPAQRSERFLLHLTQHWLTLFIVVWGVFVTLPWLAPVFMKMGATGLGNGIYFLYQFFCHQLPERSFFLFGAQPMYSLQQVGTVWSKDSLEVLRQFTGNAEFGWKVAYSDRMVSLYTGFWFAAIAFAFLRRRVSPLPIWGFLLLSLPMVIDGGTHLLSDLQAGSNFGTGFRDTNAWLAQLTSQAFPTSFYAGDALGSFNSWMRLLSGVLFGMAAIWLAFPYVDAAFQQTREALAEKLKRSVLQPSPGTARE